MKFRKVVLLFMIVGFGLIIEGVNVTRRVMNEDGFDVLSGLGDIKIDGEFPFSRMSRFRGPSVDFTTSQTIEATGVTGLEISNEFGDVTVRRTTDPKAQIGVGLRKEVFTRQSQSAESLSEQVRLVVKREGGVLKISTTRDPRAPSRIKTHFDIDTPAPLDTRITNRHGRIVVEGAKAVNVSGEYDEMRLADITGDCVAKNRHGNLEVISAALGCRVEVEYGDAHVERLLAPSKATISHGNLSALDLAGLNAILKFSDLQARKIGGALVAEGEHADLRIDDVKGEVRLNNQGDIDLQNALGRVAIDNRRGHVRLLRAAADVIIKNTYDDVAVADVTGSLDVKNLHGSIRAHRFQKGATLETDSEDVDVSDFAGLLKVVTKRGAVSVKPVRKVLAPMDISVDIGDVSVGLPSSINAIIDASVERGDVRGNVGALKSYEQGKRLLRATIGEGGPLLKLRSRLGDIRISDEEDLDVSEPSFPNAPDVEARFTQTTFTRLGADPLPVPAKALEAPKPPQPPAAPKVPAKPEPLGKSTPGDG